MNKEFAGLPEDSFRQLMSMADFDGIGPDDVTPFNFGLISIMPG